MPHTRRTLYTLLLLLGFTSVTFAEVPLNGLTEAEKRSGWTMIFDGETTQGWRNYKKEGINDGWVVKDGALVRAKRGAGDIVTEEQYDNFELALEYRISKGGNSGVMFHVQETEGAPWQTGPEIQVQDNVDGHDPQKAGWLYQLYKPAKPSWQKKFEGQVGIESPDVVDATRPAGEWNHLYIRISDKQSEICMNGVSYYKFRKGDPKWDSLVAKSKFAKFKNFGKPTKGHICLQDHGNEVAYRNIKLRKLASSGDEVPNPVDGELALQGELAFPNLQFTGFDPEGDDGKVRALRPLVLTHANDGTNRIFVGTQRGVIHVFENDPKVKKTNVVLDLSKRIRDWKGPGSNEEGLLGLAFHPDFKNNREFFVCYSTQQEPRGSKISRFRISEDNPNKAVDAEEVVMTLPQPFANHNGGSIAFGPDGYLYVALGDGGSRNDPMKNGQNLGTLLGSILRIDVNTKTGDKNYGIPADNPFVKVDGAKPEIFAYGFRNVWRIAFDRQTGHLWAADVGQDLWEEINIVVPGGNYGWSKWEASYPFNSLTGAKEPIDPVWEYDHRVGKSITGGYVYRGSRLPELAGKYVYADYVTGKIWALEYDEAAGKVTKNLAISAGGIPVLAFGEDEQGEIYYIIGAVTGKGIYRFEKK